MHSSGGNQRAAFRLEVNSPVMVRLEDFRREVSLLLMDLSEGGCRFRAGVSLPANTKISFQWTGPSQKPLRLSGAIVASRRADPKTAEYGVRFTMAVAERDKLAAELIEVQRRKAYRSADKTTKAPAPRPGADESVGGRSKRQAYRVPVQFPVTVRASKEGKVTQFKADAADLSVGGLMLLSPADFEEGEEITIRFTLPLGAVDTGGEEREETEITPFGPRKVKKRVPVRPFEPVETPAKIAKKLGVSAGKYSFGVSFNDLEAFVREEIARFIHAYQLSQLRRNASKGL